MTLRLELGNAMSSKIEELKCVFLSIGSNIEGDVLIDGAQAALQFDEMVWRRVTEQAKQRHFNAVLIDLCDGCAYPSHQELAVKGTIRIMDGAVIVKADIHSAIIKEDESSRTKEGAQALAQTINESSKVEIFYDNDESAAQATVVALPVSTDDTNWDVVPAFHFFDGSNDLAYYDFFTEEAFPKTMAQLGSVILHFREYFGKYYMKDR